jgi:ATP-dependent helicase HrpB
VPLDPLPIDPFLPDIATHVDHARAVVVRAAPGAGKTTRVPPALAPAGPVIVLQPRRVAARSIARRIADEQQWTVGDEVGWHVRFERRFGRNTRVLLATEGILTARLQQDPLLSTFRTIVIDEFHERSIHADLGIALAKQAWRARQDLRLVVMSATIDVAQVSAFLDQCPVVEVPGTLHPLDVRSAPGTSLVDGIGTGLRERSGQILCFLPGAPEIRRAHADLRPLADEGIEIVELHGSQPADEQDAAIAAVPHRRVILATNVAETSLTVPGVDVVVDTGLHKIARYDPDRAIDRLETERVSQDAADQRAGRAARLGPGMAVRLWPASDRLAPHRQPEIVRVDLAGPVLDVLAWGGDPWTFEWFQAPPAAALDASLRLLERLGACEGARLTDLGRRMQRFPLHPRLSRILLAAGGSLPAALACALLSEGRMPSVGAGAPHTASSDLLTMIEDERRLPQHVRRAADLLTQLAGSDASARALDEAGFRRALLAGYPDRVARRRTPGSPRVLLASGHGAVMAEDSGVRTGEYLVAIDVTAGRRGELSEARIRIASLVDRDWLTPTATRIVHEIDESTGIVRATAREYYDAIALAERPAELDPERAAQLLVERWRERGLSDDDERLVRRLRFAGLEPDVEQLMAGAAIGRRALDELALSPAIGWDLQQRLDRLAPDRIPVPSGRTARVEYQADGTASVSVKLQELFGLTDTPRLGPRQEPLLLVLLAPNGRPVQTTRDLGSFWARTYPEVRRELRGRYPRHPWPEDPWTAQPTARTTRR